MATPFLDGEPVEKFSFPSSPDLQHADIYVAKTVEQPEAVLVLCPGCNGNGEVLITQPIWQDFAREHQLGLIGISFASDISLLTHGRGYYMASQGSGSILLDAVKTIYGRDLPLLLYGYSGGAHFTSRFVEWKPNRVKAWCAYSAAWWDEPKKSKSTPPGIVACGEYDVWRYCVSLAYFQQGRALGKPWVWISLPKTDHAPSAPLEDFIRAYFAELLENRTSSGIWVDIDQKEEVQEIQATSYPSLTAWLPHIRLLSMWKKIHEP